MKELLDKELLIPVGAGGCVIWLMLISGPAFTGERGYEIVKFFFAVYIAIILSAIPICGINKLFKQFDRKVNRGEAVKTSKEERM